VISRSAEVGLVGINMPRSYGELHGPIGAVSGTNSGIGDHGGRRKSQPVTEIRIVISDISNSGRGHIRG